MSKHQSFGSSSKNVTVNKPVPRYRDVYNVNNTPHTGRAPRPAPTKPKASPAVLSAHTKATILGSPPPHVLKKEGASVSKLETPVVTSTAQTPINVDPISLQHFFECVILDYQKRTDIAFHGQTLYWCYYLWFLFFMHMKKNGTLTGAYAAALPAQVIGSEYAVPWSIAKYFEYLCPYTNGTNVSSAFQASQALFGPPPTGGFGMYPGQGVFDRDETDTAIPGWFLLNGVSDPETALQILGDYAIGWGSYFIGKESSNTVPLSFAEFITDPANLLLYSGYTQKKNEAVPLSNIASSAPDLTAYARCGLRPAANQRDFTSGVFGPTSNFVAELAPMFSINSYNAGQYASYTAKSMVGPVSDAPFSAYPYYTQLAFAFIFVANCKPYKPGSIYSYKVCHKKLKTLYPQFHMIDGIKLSHRIQKAYNQIIVAKGISGPQDPNYFNLATFAACAYYALQRKLNFTEVVHLTDPQTIDPTTTSQRITPQICYADATWGAVKLPTMITDFIDHVGVVVVDGVMRVPQVNYMNKPTGSGIANSALGPWNWSTYGFTGTEDEYFGGPNLYSSAWSSTDLNVEALLPNVTVKQGTGIGISTGANIWNQANIPAYYGWVNIIVTDGVELEVPAINSIVANGTAANTLVTNYKNFVSFNNNVNQIPLAAPRQTKWGDEAVMTATISWDKNNGSTEGASQFGMIDTAPTEPSETYNMQTAYPDISNIGCKLPMSPQDALNAGTGAASDQEASTPAIYQEPGYLATVFKVKKKLIKRETVVDNPEIAAILPHSLDPQLSGGTAGILSGMAQALISPNSTSAQSLYKFMNKQNPLSNVDPPPLKSILAPHLLESAKQFVSGLPMKSDPKAYYAARQGVGSLSVQPPSKPQKHHPLANVVGGMYKMATGMTADVAKGEKFVTSLLGKDL